MLFKGETVAILHIVAPRLNVDNAIPGVEVNVLEVVQRRRYAFRSNDNIRGDGTALPRWL